MMHPTAEVSVRRCLAGVLVIGAGLALAACGGSTPDGSVGPSTTTESSASPGAGPSGQPPSIMPGTSPPAADGSEGGTGNQESRRSSDAYACTAFETGRGVVRVQWATGLPVDTVSRPGRTWSSGDVRADRPGGLEYIEDADAPKGETVEYALGSAGQDVATCSVTTGSAGAGGAVDPESLGADIDRSREIGGLSPVITVVDGKPLGIEGDLLIVPSSQPDLRGLAELATDSFVTPGGTPVYVLPADSVVGTSMSEALEERLNESAPEVEVTVQAPNILLDLGTVPGQG